MLYWVYIVKCADGSFYTGHCLDVDHRVREHNLGEGARHTRQRRPVVLVFKEPFETESHAVRRERQLKRWSHAKKDALVRGD